MGTAVVSQRFEYAVQGYYKQLDGSRKWKDWQTFESLQKAKRGSKYFGPFKWGEQMHMPSASRIVERTIYEEVLNFEGE